MTGYAIYLAFSASTADNPTSQQFITRISSRTTYYRLSSLNPGSVYYYRVRPYKADGQLNEISRGITVHTTPGMSVAKVVFLVLIDTLLYDINQTASAYRLEFVSLQVLPHTLCKENGSHFLTW